MDLEVKAKLLGINSYPESQIRLFSNWNLVHQEIKKNIVRNALFFLKWGLFQKGGNLDTNFISQNFKNDYLNIRFENEMYKVRMEVMNDYENELINEYLKNNTSLDKTIILYIGFSKIEDNPCSIVIIDEVKPNYYEAIIQSIGKKKLICEHGKKLMRVTLRLLKKIGVNRVILSDNSTITINETPSIEKEIKVSLSKYYLIKTGKTWYESHFNFKPIDDIFRPNPNLKLRDIITLSNYEQFQNYISKENEDDLVSIHISKLINIYPQIVNNIIPYSLKTDFVLDFK